MSGVSPLARNVFGIAVGKSIGNLYLAFLETESASQLAIIGTNPKREVAQLLLATNKSLSL